MRRSESTQDEWTQPDLFGPTSSVVGSPAKICPSLESDAALQEAVAAYFGQCGESSRSSSRRGSSSKTSLDYCHRTEGGTWEPSSGRWLTAGIASPGGCWTASFSDWPSDASVCSLSDILETCDVPLRYFLTAKACAGILHRAEKRGKALPERLKLALMVEAFPEATAQ